MNKYLEKIAEKSDSENGFKTIRTGLGVVTGGQVLGIGSLAHGYTGKNKTDTSLLRSYIREHKLRKDVGLSSSSYKAAKKYGGSIFSPNFDRVGPHLMPGDSASHGLTKPKKYMVNVVHNSDPAIHLHELGHANFHRKVEKVPGGKAIMGVGRVATKFSPAIATGTYFGVKGADSDTKANAIAGAAMASQVPTLVDEAAASGSALKHILKKRGLKSGLGAAARLGAAFSSYAGMASLPAIAAHYANKERKQNGK